MQNNPQLRPLRDSFACVAAALICVDGKISKAEMSRFHDFFAREFGVEEHEADAFLEVAKGDLGSLDQHIEELSAVLPENLVERGRFMRYFNDCIISDGIDQGEYPIFDKIRDALFPKT